MVKCSHCLLYVFCVMLVFSSYYFLFQIVINYLLLRISNNHFFSNYLFVLMYLFLLFLLVIDLFVITTFEVRINMSFVEFDWTFFKNMAGITTFVTCLNIWSCPDQFITFEGVRRNC